MYHSSFMSRRIPEWVNPFQLVEKWAAIEGHYAISSLPRVKAAVFHVRGEFAVRLEFRPDAAWHAVVAGQLVGTVTLQCQRCLGSMAIDLNISPHLGLCTSEVEAERLPKELEPLIVEDGSLNVREVVEDEIMLAFPLVPRHAQPCREMPGVDAKSPAPEDEDTRRPFRNLRKMLDEDG